MLVLTQFLLNVGNLRKIYKINKKESFTISQDGVVLSKGLQPLEQGDICCISAEGCCKNSDYSDA